MLFVGFPVAQQVSQRQQQWSSKLQSEWREEAELAGTNQRVREIKHFLIFFHTDFGLIHNKNPVERCHIVRFGVNSPQVNYVWLAHGSSKGNLDTALEVESCSFL